MLFEITMLYTYRFLALVVAAMMIWSVMKDKNWQEQVFAAMVFVPFALRAAGVK